MDVKYISLHRYIRNTPSDTEVLAEHPSESRQEYLTTREDNLESCRTL